MDIKNMKNETIKSNIILENKNKANLDVFDLPYF